MHWRVRAASAQCRALQMNSSFPLDSASNRIVGASHCSLVVGIRRGFCNDGSFCEVLTLLQMILICNKTLNESEMRKT